MQKDVMPVKGYQKAGTFNKDSKPGYQAKERTEHSRKIGSKDGLNFSEHVTSTASSGGGTPANFTTDQDMGLIKNAGKSGKY
jgi:hypothetical protein